MNPDLITVAVEHRGDIAVIVVSGEVDVLSVPALDEAINDLIGDGPRPLIVDLSAVTFLGSAGLRSLVSTQQRLSGAAGFAVVANGAPTSRIIQLTHFDEAFLMCLTLDEALRCVRDS